MNVLQENTGTLTATVCIEVEKSDYSTRVDEKLREYRKKVKMPGFREGKVPMGVVNKMYGKSILAEEINQLISEALEKHLDEQQIQTLASPLPNRDKQQTIDFDTQDIFSFYFDVALKPEITIDLDALENIKLYNVEPDESRVNEYMQHIRKSFGKFTEADTAAEGDIVHCKIDEVNDAGENFTGGISAEGSIAIDKIIDDEIKGQFVNCEPGKIIRMNPMAAFDNKTEVAALLNVKTEELPEPLNHFDFKVTSIKRLTPAEIDEELLKEVFPNDQLKSEEELLERVRKDIVVSYAREAETLMFNKTLDTLLEKTAVELPDVFLKRWLLETAGEDGKSTTPEDIEENYDGYAKQLRIALVRNQIISDFELRVTEDDYYSYIFKALGIDPDEAELDETRKLSVQHIIENIRKDKKQAEKIGERILEDKIADLLRQKVPYQQETISTESFTELLKEI